MSEKDRLIMEGMRELNQSCKVLGLACRELTEMYREQVAVVKGLRIELELMKQRGFLVKGNIPIIGEVGDGGIVKFSEDVISGREEDYTELHGDTSDCIDRHGSDLESGSGDEFSTKQDWIGKDLPQ